MAFLGCQSGFIESAVRLCTQVTKGFELDEMRFLGKVAPAKWRLVTATFHELAWTSAIAVSNNVAEEVLYPWSSIAQCPPAGKTHHERF